MAKSNDPLIESLMQMAVAAAPLIRKARESGIFRERESVVDADVVPAKAPEAPEAPTAPATPAADVTAQGAAMQDIIVRQALRINDLEAELAKLKANAPAKSKAKPKPGPAKAAKA